MKFKTAIRALFFTLVVALILATCSLIGGCEILKSKRSSSADSTSVSRKTEANNSDSSGGRVSKEQSNSKNEYERTTFIYPPRDTTVLNVYNQPPSTIIYEKGKSEQATTRVDSGWFKMMEQQLKSMSDSLSSSRKENSKDVEKQTKGVGLIAVILIALGAVVLFKLMGWGLGKFTIVRK